MSYNHKPSQQTSPQQITSQQTSPQQTSPQQYTTLPLIPFMIACAVLKKSKRSFTHNFDALIRFANSIQPLYHSFILKVIKNNSLKIRVTSTPSCCNLTDPNSLDDTASLRKRKKITIDLQWGAWDSLSHELGHACDNWFGCSLSLTSRAILSNGKTFQEVFDKELEEKHEEIYKSVMKEFQLIIASNINPKAFDIVMDENNRVLYSSLTTVEFDENNKELCQRRKEIQRELYESGYVEAYYQLLLKKCNATLNRKYSPVLDALSSKYNLHGLGLDHHLLNYYSYDDELPASETFANLFEGIITNKRAQMCYFKKFFPETFEAFKELFLIIVTHILNNRRFTDLKIKKEVTNDVDFF